MKIAVFLSHPIQHFSPLWKEIAARDGIDLKVFYFSRHGVDATHDPGFGAKFQWDVDLLEGYASEFLTRRWPTRNIYDATWKGLNKGFKRILAQGWDAVYVSGYAHLNNWLIARECRRQKIPPLYHSDSNFLTEKERPAWRKKFKGIVVKKFFRNVTAFLATGDHNRDYLLYYGAHPDRIRFCAIPVDTERFRQKAFSISEAERKQLKDQLGFAKQTFVVGFSGKLIDRKRPNDLIAALKSNDDTNIQALFIGSGPLEGALRVAAGEQARFAGFVNQSKMPLLISLCDLVVMPSEYDPHPLAVTEAQCLGIPVILSDKCGCYGPNDVFRDGQSGLVYPCGDVQKLAQAINTLAENSSLRASLGSRAKELAELHSPKATADNFLAGVDRVLSTALD